MQQNTSYSRFSTTKKWVLRIGIAIVIVLVTVFVAVQISPWPGALAIRLLFDKGGVEANNKLADYVPTSVTHVANKNYDAANSNALLDIYYPTSFNNSDSLLPVVFWVHGGGWISGSKNQVANYCKILASKGFVVVAIDYTIAPEATYPTPLIQVQKALQYVIKNAQLFHANSSCIFFAGDSAGSHIVAQSAQIIVDSSYANLVKVTPMLPANSIKGMLLYCGPYNTKGIKLDGGFGFFLKTVLWSYSGKKDFLNDAYFATANIHEYVNHLFPPSFISVGNADPLATHSIDLARKLVLNKVEVDTLFYPTNYNPSLGHEYQFDINTEAGKKALDQSVAFLYKYAAIK